MLNYHSNSTKTIQFRDPDGPNKSSLCPDTSRNPRTGSIGPALVHSVKLVNFELSPLAQNETFWSLLARFNPCWAKQLRKFLAKISLLVYAKAKLASPVHQRQKWHLLCAQSTEFTEDTTHGESEPQGYGNVSSGPRGTVIRMFGSQRRGNTSSKKGWVL